MPCLRYILILLILTQSPATQAQKFNQVCLENWNRQELRPEFTNLLEHSRKISVELAQQLMQQGMIAELELRLLEKALEQEPRFQIHLAEIKLLLEKQQPCEKAELLVSGVPLKESTFAELQKSFHYQIEHRTDEMPELAKSYDTIENQAHSSRFGSRQWLWISAAVGVLAAVYLQRNYEIEY